MLVGRLVPLRCNPSGQLLGWYRLGSADGPAPADNKLESWKAEDVLCLHLVEGRTLLLSVEIQVESTIRLKLPVSTAIPASMLVDSLAAMLELPAGDWVLALDGNVLGAHTILEDRNLTVDSVLLVRRA